MKAAFQIILLLVIPCQCVALIQPALSLTSFISKNTGNVDDTKTKLGMGGYDATIGANPSTPLQFFTLPGNTCPYAQRTLIALRELGIPFDTTEVSGRPKPDWYLKINPRGKVPAIRVPTCDNEVIYESAICNEFLCDYAIMALNKDQTLLPQNPVLRARIRLLNDHCDTVFAKTQFTFLMNKEEEKDKMLADEMETALAMYEEALVGSGGPYLLGGEFTLADVHILPFIQRLIITLRHWKGYELPKEKLPNLLTWFDACAQRDAVKESSITEEKIIEVYGMFMKAEYKFGGLNKN